MIRVGHQLSPLRAVCCTVLLVLVVVFTFVVPATDHCDHMGVEHNDGATPHMSSSCLVHMPALMAMSAHVPDVNESSFPRTAAYDMNRGLAIPYLPFQPPRV